MDDPVLLQSCKLLISCIEFPNMSKYDIFFPQGSDFSIYLAQELAFFAKMFRSETANLTTREDVDA